VKKAKKRKVAINKQVAIARAAPLIGPAEAGILELPPVDDPGNSSKSSSKEGGTY